MLITLVNIVGLLAAIVVLYVVLGATATGFLSLNNQLGLLRQAAIIGIAATGIAVTVRALIFFIHNAAPFRR